MRIGRGVMAIVFFGAIGALSMTARSASPPDVSVAPSASVSAAQGADEANGPACNCRGSYRCPTNGSKYPYGQPGCGLPSPEEAAAACNFICASVCADMGVICTN